MTQAIIRAKDLGNSVTIVPMTLRPKWYSFSAMGGPKLAKIDISGSRDAVFNVLNYLRNPIALYSNIANPVWWGYIESISLAVGAVEFEVSMRSMYNEIQIVYTTSNNLRNTTDAIENSHSIGLYGRKKLLGTLNSVGLDAATNQAEELLELLAYPIAQTRTTNDNRIGASITASGWWETLSWLYYSRGEGVAGCYEGVADSAANLGDTSSNEKLAHYFSATGWGALIATIQIAVEGSPSDSVRVSIYDDNGSQTAPGSTQIGYADVTAANIGNGGAITFEFSSLLTLSGDHWIVIERTGAADASNYYGIYVATEELLCTGRTQVYNGSTWSQASPDSNIIFSVAGGENSNLTIEDILEDAGQFFNGYQVEETSLPVFIYRDGDTTALKEVLKLMGAGVDGGRRLVSYVDKDRNVRIREDETLTRNQVKVFLHGDGTYRDRAGNRVEHTCPIGWVQFKDVFPTSLDTSGVTVADAFYIEESEYNVETGRLTIVPRMGKEVWDIGGFSIG